jgi:hypothetical protein
LPARYTRPLLVAYGLLNAALYSSLLPLWEGFDEEFHYGYVQYLHAHRRFPVLGPTALSREINRTIDLMPISHLMIRNVRLHGVRSFDQYFALDSATRRALKRDLYSIPTDLRLTESNQHSINYEVHHAPLPYLAMAIPDAMLSGVPIPRRVWILRLLLAAACVGLTFVGLWALGAESGLDSAFTAALVFLMFSCQMYWATIAHIGNDWLAVPIAVWLIVWALRHHRQPSTRTAVWLSVIMGLGLLSKAYFLVFVPLYALAALVWRKRWAVLFAIPAVLSGPWYVRNLVLYGNLSGRLEESNGVTTVGALQSLASVPWLKSLPFMARGTFWLGNSSFTDFSVVTMNAVLLLVGIGWLLYIRNRKPSGGAFLWAPVVLFCCAMIYVAGSAYTYTKGEATVASPWYLQAVMGPLLCVSLIGCQRAGRAGRWIAAAEVVLWGYVLAATYVAKLFPLYGGFTGGRSTLRDIARWYTADWPRTSDILSTTAMVTAPWLVVLLSALLMVLLATMAMLLRSLTTAPAESASSVPLPQSRRRSAGRYSSQ